MKLIEENYGRNKITPNLHLSLHLCECSFDYGLLYTFWCFSFERMNGMLGIVFSVFSITLYYFSFINNVLINLGLLPNSNRKIEPEIMRHLMFDNQVSNIINSGVETKGLDLLNN